MLTPNEKEVAEDRPDCFWLYIVTHCETEPQLQEPIKNPARITWHEFTKVQHYWLNVNALKHPWKFAKTPVLTKAKRIDHVPWDRRLPARIQT